MKMEFSYKKLAVNTRVSKQFSNSSFLKTKPYVKKYYSFFRLIFAKFGPVLLRFSGHPVLDLIRSKTHACALLKGVNISRRINMNETIHVKLKKLRILFRYSLLFHFIKYYCSVIFFFNTRIIRHTC